MTRTLPALLAPLLLGVSIAAAPPATDEQLLEAAKVSRDTPALLGWVLLSRWKWGRATRVTLN